MGGQRKYNYGLMEMEFVRHAPGELSLRALAAKHEMPVSTLTEWAKHHNWEQKQAERHNATESKMIEELSAREARRRLREVEVVDNLIDMVDEGIMNVREGISRGAIQLRPKDLTDMVDKVFAAFGKASAITEGRNVGLGVQITGDADSEGGRAAISLLSGLVERTRGGDRSTPAGRPGGSSLPSAPDASQDK